MYLPMCAPAYAYNCLCMQLPIYASAYVCICLCIQLPMYATAYVCSCLCMPLPMYALKCYIKYQFMADLLFDYFGFDQTSN